MSTRIAHFTDLHIGPIGALAMRHWNLKRALGFINWHYKRRYLHRPDTLARLVEDARRQAPDHWAITGDLVNIALPFEYVQAARWLAELGPAERVSVVPGNHDIYTPLWSDPGVQLWQDYMTSDAWGRDVAGSSNGFPFVRRVGDVCIVGVNSAVPTAPGFATGLVGLQQIREIRRVLRLIGEARLFRLVLIHHPPIRGLSDGRRQLRDAHDLEAVFGETGAELVVYGHNHISRLNFIDSAGGQIPVVGLGSATVSRVYKDEDLGRYNIYEIGRGTDGWKIEVTARGLAFLDGDVVEIDRRSIGLREA